MQSSIQGGGAFTPPPLGSLSPLPPGIVNALCMVSVIDWMDDSTTLSSAMHVEPPTKLHIAILPPPPLAQTLKETLWEILVIFRKPPN